MANGVEQLRDAIGGLARDDPGLRAMGLEVVSVRVSSIAPDATVEKALQTPTRESIQQQADEATFSRRALAVEKERAIAENELQNRIELARRQAQLVDQEGRNERRRAEEAAAAARIEAEGSPPTELASPPPLPPRACTPSKASAWRSKRSGSPHTAPSPPNALLALAAREFAAKIERIEHLNLSPDMLSPFLADLPPRRPRAARSPLTAGDPATRRRCRSNGRRPQPRGASEMAGAIPPRVVVVTRQTEYAALLARHGTREQARFFLATRGRTIEELEATDAVFRAALGAVSAAIPTEWRRVSASTAAIWTGSCSSRTT
jgi:hypothetical protein